MPVAFQAGLDTVGEAMNDAEICAFVEKAIYEEIIPVLDLPRDELESFASAVTGRFRNPYIKHQLLSIALNGMTSSVPASCRSYWQGRRQTAHFRRALLSH